MIKQPIEPVDLWRRIDLRKDKSKPAPGSYEDDIENLDETMQKGVKIIK